MTNVFDILEERGYIEQMTHPAEIKELFGKESVPFYIGIDPTADSLHVGHFVSLMVARFVENVDRSKIITAGSIMITRPAIARLRKEGPEVLIRKMKERDITVLPVIDENDKLIGEITLESAAILRRKGIKSIQEAVQSEVHSVTEDTKIEDLLPLITKTNSPIYVVNEERELKGLVPLSSIVVEMTGKDKEEINELIQNAIEL